MFQAHPVLGAGINRYRIEAEQYGRSTPHAHNTWRTLLAELGLVGCLSYLAIFGCALCKSIKFYLQYPQYRVMLGILVGVTLAFLVLSLSMEIRGSLYHNTLLFALWAMILELVCRRTTSDRAFRQRIGIRQVSTPRVTA
jgi:O-antigen ligase